MSAENTDKEKINFVSRYQAKHLFDQCYQCKSVVNAIFGQSPAEEVLMKTTLLLIAALLGGPQENVPSHPPKPAPRIYVSREFGLMMTVPPGLSYCALPKKWSGTEEGTVLFLEPPSACLDMQSGSSTVRPIAGFVPSITVHYRANRERYDNFDGAIPKAPSSKELARQFCPEPLHDSELKLFGQPAFGCRSDQSGNKVKIVLFALYGPEHNILTVSLLTTQERLDAGMQMLGKISSSINACDPEKKQTDISACTRGSTW
jgi:hypothetical protein